ncbi:MAG: tyrosine-type recombinase/integrase [bacterium]
MLISEAFASYYQIISFKNQSSRTAEMHFTALKSLLKTCGEIPIESLTFEHIRQWKELMEKEGKSQNTIRAYIIKLRCVVVHMRKIKVSCIDVDEIPLPKRENTIPSWITPEQVSKLIQTCSHKRAKAIVSLLYSSGIRVSELTQLNRDQLHEGKFTIIGKGNKLRLCFYDQRTATAIELYLKTRVDNHPALFIQRISKQRMNKSGIERIFVEARNKGGFTQKITPHTLRHSFATDLAQKGIAIHNLQTLMGHSSIATTGMYLHVSNPRLQEEYKKYHTV